MPTIPDYLQDKMDDVDSTPRGRGPIPEGYRVLVMTECEEDEKPAGPGVNCTFKIVEGPNRGATLKYNWLSFSEGGIWKVKQLFDAAGYTYDSDVQELVDDEVEVVAFVAVEIQSQGKNKGKEVNNIAEFLEATDDNRKLVD